MKRPLPVIKISTFFLIVVIVLTIPLESKSQDCDTVRITDFPAKDLPVSFDTAQLKKGSSYKYYYGIGVKVDYVKARHLAFVEMKANYQDYFAGSYMLMMIYANGYGVKRRLDLCIRIACADMSAATAELEGRVDHLKAMQEGDTANRFDICDDITSGLMMGVCSGLQSEKAEVTRKAKINSVINKWPEKDKAAYNVLRKSATGFFNQRSRDEVDISGTARAMFSIEESDALEDGFLDHILKADKCAFVKYTDADFAKADKQLNSVYSKAMKTEDSPVDGTITRKGIQSTQRKWIQYRDAWVKFAAVRCPEATAASLKTLFTNERIKQLDDSLGNEP